MLKRSCIGPFWPVEVPSAADRYRQTKQFVAMAAAEVKIQACEEFGDSLDNFQMA